uniref:Uncharacterized protein n=1 Tax=Sinocyclocheilus grahami TaxID=75366 RepID=A0A672S1K7_SINGR
MKHIQGPLLFSPACYVQWTRLCKNSSGCTFELMYIIIHFLCSSLAEGTVCGGVHEDKTR